MVSMTALVALLPSLCTVVNAYPYGAPNCVLNEASPESSHTGARPTGVLRHGLVSEHGLDLVLNGQRVGVSGMGLNRTHPFVVTTGRDYTVQFVPSLLSPPNGTKVDPLWPEPWRGVLLILHDPDQAVDLSASLLPVAPYVAAPSCGGFLSLESGVTHADRDIKSPVAAVARLRMDRIVTKGIRLDVNLVVANNVTHSIFYYTQFWLASANPTAPIRAPVAGPVRAPVAGPVRAPVAGPVRAPLNAPVNAPVGPPIAAPISLPVHAPKSLVATRTPRSAPIPMTPVVKSTKAPTMASKKCGLFGWRIVCPVTQCGLLGRLLGRCQT